MKADEKIEEQNRIIDMLQRQKEKDVKVSGSSKKHYERQIQELKTEIERLISIIVEKDKDLKVQALKLRELIHDEFRKETIMKNYSELERLSYSPRT